MVSFKLADIQNVANEAAAVVAGDDVEARDVWDELRDFRSGHEGPPFTVEEILSLRDEGRR